MCALCVFFYSTATAFITTVFNVVLSPDLWSRTAFHFLLQFLCMLSIIGIIVMRIDLVSHNIIFCVIVKLE